MVEDSLYSHNLVDKRLDILGLDGGPVPDLGQVLIVVGDVALDLLSQILQGGKVPSVEDMLAEDAEPDFDRIEPAIVLGRVDKTDAMSGITQISLSRFHALEYAPLVFFT